MKKHQRKLAALLALLMALSLVLSGCGGTGESAGQTTAKGGRGETAAQPEYTYKTDFTELTGAGSSLNVMAYTEDGAYASCNEKTGREIPETADVENMTEDDLKNFDVYATLLYFLGKDGSVTKLENYQPLPGKENEEDYTDFYSASMLSAIAVDDSGRLQVVEYVYSGWYNGTEETPPQGDEYYADYKYVQEYYIRTLDETGTELSRVPLKLSSDQYLGSAMTTDADGNLLFAVNTQLMAFDPQGAPAYTIECGGYISTFIRLADGRLYAAVWGDSGMDLAEIDSEGRKIAKTLSLPDNAYSPIAGGGEYDLYYTSGLSFCGYDLETETSTPLFNWLNCDINGDTVNGLFVNSDGTVTGLVTEADYSDGNESYTNQRFTVSKTPYDPSAAAETLSLACLSLDYEVQNAVIKYNRSGVGPRIEIKDYSSYNTDEDSSAGEQKLLTEMMAGTVADMVCLSGLPYRRIAAKGLLEDLYPYLDADDELRREDIFPNILSTLEVENGLYGVCPSFSVESVMGAVSVVGDGSSWTYDEFEAALASMPEGCEPFESGVSRGDILRRCVSLDMAKYIDWSAGKCSFDSQEFVELLEFASLFPATHTDDREESTQSRIQSGQQMLVITSFYGVDSALYDEAYFGGAEVNYIGFPTLSGSGNVLNLESCYGMSSDCRDKDAAWQFLRILLSEKYQKQSVWTIPTNLAAFDVKLAEAMKVNYKMDENGQFVLDANGDKIKMPRYTMSSGDGPVVDVYAMTQDQADKITSVISGATKSFDSDQSIIDIVTQEAEAFFAGQKTAQEVASLIQGKINIYVNEQS